MGDDTTKMLIKVALLGLAGYFVYNWLQNSGLWGEYFGFSSVTQLQTYCAQNPSGTATYNGQSATCAQWTAALAAASPSTTASTSTTPTTPPVQTTQTSAPAEANLTTAEQSLVTSLNNAAVQSGNQTLLTVSQWNWLMNNVTNPGSSAAQLPQFGNATIDAGTYVAARSSGGFGLSGFRPALVQRPYRWMM